MLARSLTAAGFLLSLAACVTTAPEQEASAEQYICADPETRAAKGGQAKCEAFYTALRGEEGCAGMTTLECVKLLRGLETAGFSPKAS